jgi:hypothetical protein
MDFSILKTTDLPTPDDRSPDPRRQISRLKTTDLLSKIRERETPWVAPLLVAVDFRYPHLISDSAYLKTLRALKALGIPRSLILKKF